MFIITVTAHFSAAHRIPDYPGPCVRLHGHRWVVRAIYQKDILDNLGMSLDLTLLKKALQAAVHDLDHENLSAPNRQHLIPRPTAENIAQLVYHRLSKGGPVQFGRYLVSVEVEEEPGSSVRYFHATTVDPSHLRPFVPAKVVDQIQKETEKDLGQVNPDAEVQMSIEKEARPLIPPLQGSPDQSIGRPT